MGNLKRELTFKDGLPLALGSIIGSGLLFLPSLTYSIAGQDVGLIWVLTTLLCVPLLFIFQAALERVPNESGVEGFISEGLGRKIGGGVPILFLGTVSLGMPASALIVGQYLQKSTGASPVIVPLAALAIVWLSVILNTQGITFGSNIQRLISAVLLGLGLVLFGLTFKDSVAGYTNLQPVFMWGPTFSAVTVAFWAYAGFENLTFMAGEFKNPKRDLTLSILVSLILSGILYLGLSANYAALIPRAQVDENLGLLQLANVTAFPVTMTAVVAVIAFVAVQFNFNSWLWGISRLIYSSSKKGILPNFFSTLNSNAVPARALVGLAILFSLNILIGAAFPEFVKKAVVIASTNFVMIYVLTVLSYLRLEKRWPMLLVGVVVVALLLIAMLQSGTLVLYPVVLIVLGAVVAKTAITDGRGEK